MHEYIAGIPLTVIRDGAMIGMPIFKTATVSNPAFRAMLREAEVLLAVDAVTHLAISLFGEDALQAMLARSNGGTPIKTKLVALEYTPDTDELEQLVAVTRGCKGVCDLETAEVNSGC